jgi:hypothetical protein
LKAVHTNRIRQALLLTCLLAGNSLTSVPAQNQNKATTTNPFAPTNVPPAFTRAVFILPISSRDGRDPFYPESIRLVAEAAPTSGSFDISSLKVPGISGTPGHLFAIINNHTFGIGDEGDVVTPSGRVHLRCVDINPELVTIEINGQIHRIRILLP